MIKVGDHVMRYIPIEAISAGMILGRDIIGDNTETAAMLVKGTTLTEDYVEYLKSRGYSGVYIYQTGYQRILLLMKQSVMICSVPVLRQ